MHVAISGSSGLIGKALTAALVARGDQVSRFVRRPHARDASEIPWNPIDGSLDAAALAGVDACVHLAGENVGDGRWSPERKAAIRESRVLGTRTLVDALGRAAPRPRTLVSASAIGYYGGERGDAPCDESTPPGHDFLAEVCVAWESEATRAEGLGVRVVRPRVGVVLTPEGGALERLVGPFKAGLGGKVGSGRQWFSWVTLADVVRAFLFALDTEALIGPANVVSGAVTQAEFAHALGRALGRPAIMPLPGFAVKMIFGEMGRTLLLGGQRVVARALAERGFAFADGELEAALRRLLGR